MRKILFLTILSSILAACTPDSGKTINVVPYPNDVRMAHGTFDAKGAGFYFSAGFDTLTLNIISNFAEKLSVTSGSVSSVQEGISERGFVFVHDSDMPEESYSLEITRKSVTVRASELRGVNYAIQTLKQMLPVQIFGTQAASGADWKLPCATISDAPRFRYRGMHMDVSRHFFDMEMVKKYLDIMEVHKLNRLHWHITDDQGWRIEIKKYPKLTEVGSIRKQTLVGHLSKNNTYDGTPYGEGCWFSQEQIKEIIAYAAGKGIDIIPEIDLPGHMLAALAAYPEYGCTGGPYEVWGRWGVSDEVLCAGNENTMIFLENILEEVAGLFPSEYIHIGGDECPKVRWEKCPKCQAKIRELGLRDDDRFKAEHYLQSYVMKRMTSFLEGKGKKIIGWDEILEGEVAESATVMSWRGVSGGLKAARMGNYAIMTPNSFFYLDYYQSLDKANEPLGIGGYVPIEKCYSYEPFADGMTEEEKAHIIGVQANLWTEYIATEGHLEYMLLPRMAALSEVQWCHPDNKDWNRFLESADDFCSIYDTMGYNYATHIFNAKGNVSINRKDKTVEVGLHAQGTTPVYYTLDGSEPDEKSPVYVSPIQISGDCTLKAVSYRNGRKGRIYEKSFNLHKAMGCPVDVLAPPHPNYTYSYPDILTDGLRGSGPFNSGDFSGWYNQDLEAVIDMGEKSYSNVTLSTLIHKYDYIFPPTFLRISISDNGTDFTEAAYAGFDLQGRMHDGNGCKEYTLDFPETSARYLKVQAGCLKALPDWHPGAGRPGFVFVDEIVVR